MFSVLDPGTVVESGSALSNFSVHLDIYICVRVYIQERRVLWSQGYIISIIEKSVWHSGVNRRTVIRRKGAREEGIGRLALLVWREVWVGCLIARIFFFCLRKIKTAPQFGVLLIS